MCVYICELRGKNLNSTRAQRERDDDDIHTQV